SVACSLKSARGVARSEITSYLQPTLQTGRMELNRQLRPRCRSVSSYRDAASGRGGWQSYLETHGLSALRAAKPPEQMSIRLKRGLLGRPALSPNLLTKSGSRS